MLFRASIATMAVALLVSAAHTQEVDFSDKTIEFIVPYGPGGGSSVHARAIAPLLEQELPGNPTIVIRNVEGGGSVRGLNLFAQQADPDGLTIAAPGSGGYIPWLLGEPVVQYPLDEFIPVLASPYGQVAYGRTDVGLNGDPLHDLHLLREHKFVHVGTGPGLADMPTMYCYALLGIEVTGVWGVDRGEARQAFQRGESQLNYDNLATWGSNLKPMLDDGTMVPIFTLGFRTAEGTIARDPTLPETPTCLELYELANGAEMTGPQREAHDAMFAIRMLVAKTIALPPGTPDDIVRTYQNAMARVIERPEMDDPVLQLELGGYPQAVGEAALEGHRTATNLSEEALQEIRTWLADTWQRTY